MFKVDEIVNYVYVRKAIIEKVHFDDAPNLYYTIKILNSNKICQTVINNIKLIIKKGVKEPFDNNDIILYIKNIKTKIYNIIKKKKETYYEIKINNNFKYVKGNKLIKNS